MYNQKAMSQAYSFFQNSSERIEELLGKDFSPKLKLGKRLFDILFSIAILIFLSPLIFLIGIIIKLTSPGPVFYSHPRVKLGGKPFHLVKFRTMYIDADEKLHLLLDKNPVIKMEWESFRKIRNDPRVTSFGKFLRKLSLDELPQFWNALKGDISIVGPRPVKEEEILCYYKEKSSKILAVRPGITGIWQVSGRNTLSMEERVKLEVSYIERQSFCFDLWMIVKTIPAILFSKGAF